jgi:class 3 adenylate cyclase
VRLLSRLAEQGSDIRHSYTMIGGAVNLGSCLEGLSKTYGVDTATARRIGTPCDVQLLNLQRLNGQKYLYHLCAERVASMRLLPFDPAWDGATISQPSKVKGPA